MIRRILTLLLICILLAGLLPLKVSATQEKAGIVTTAGGNLNVRSGPSSGSAVLARLANGSPVTLVSRSGAWWQVTYDRGKYGYRYRP